MAIPQHNQRFFSSTPGQIVVLLRREGRTVDELAQLLNLTDNAIRAHLTTLERDGIVQQRGTRRTGSKPASIYELAPGAEQLFPKAYGSVLRLLLGVLAERMSSEEVAATMREVGHQFAARWSMPTGNLYARLQAAIKVLKELGGMAELEARGEHYCIHGYSCPLAAAVPGHPEVCCLTEALLTELVGVPLQAQCDCGQTPRCCFVIRDSSSATENVYAPTS